MMTLSEDGEELVVEKLRCEDVDKTYTHKEIFIESLNPLIRHSMREYGGNKRR